MSDNPQHSAISRDNERSVLDAIPQASESMILKHGQPATLEDALEQIAGLNAKLETERLASSKKEKAIESLRKQIPFTVDEEATVQGASTQLERLRQEYREIDDSLHLINEHMEYLNSKQVSCPAGYSPWFANQLEEQCKRRDKMVTVAATLVVRKGWKPVDLVEFMQKFLPETADKKDG